jgi:hypothetical protein
MPISNRLKQLNQLRESKKKGKVANDDSDSDSDSGADADLKLNTKAVKKKRKTIKNNGSALAALLHDSDRDSDIPFDEAINTKKVTNKKTVEGISCNNSAGKST